MDAVERRDRFAAFLILPAALFYTYVCLLSWRWFVVPLGVPDVTLVHFFGLRTLWHGLRGIDRPPAMLLDQVRGTVSKWAETPGVPWQVVKNEVADALVLLAVSGFLKICMVWL